MKLRLSFLLALCVHFAHAASEPVLPPFEFATHERAATATVFLRQLRFDGNQVIATADLQERALPFLNRALSPADLLALRDALTQLYVDAGYLSSGARLGDISDGELTVVLAENPLTAVKVTTDGRLRPARLQRVLRTASADGPFNIFAVERSLQLLLQNPAIAQLDARVQPGATPGEALLYVEAQQTQPWSLDVSLNNHQSTSVGEVRTDAYLQLMGPLGIGDELNLNLSYAEGLREGQLAYALPLNAAGTTLTATLEAANTEVVAQPFDELGIEAESRSARLELTQPLRRDLRMSVDGFITASIRRSKTFLLGQGFSFVSGPDEGEVDLTVVTAGLQAQWRGLRNVMAARLEVAKGVDAFGATSQSLDGFAGGRAPDPDFFSVHAQAQWARRLTFLNSQLLLRGQAQLASDPLFGMVQHPVGGRHSVRGYRENTLIRDSVLGASVEWRVPLSADVAGRSRLELGPFFDWSRSWNVERGEVGPAELKSVGLGLSWRPTRQWWLELQWGHALDRVRYPGEHSLTDDGVHVSLWYSPR